jgi:hypothetical protein
MEDIKTVSETNQLELRAEVLKGIALLEFAIKFNSDTSTQDLSTRPEVDQSLMVARWELIELGLSPNKKSLRRRYAALLEFGKQRRLRGAALLRTRNPSAVFAYTVWSCLGRPFGAFLRGEMSGKDFNRLTAAASELAASSLKLWRCGHEAEFRGILDRLNDPRPELILSDWELSQREWEGFGRFAEGKTVGLVDMRTTPDPADWQ